MLMVIVHSPSQQILVMALLKLDLKAWKVMLPENTLHSGLLDFGKEKVNDLLI